MAKKQLSHWWEIEATIDNFTRFRLVFTFHRTNNKMGIIIAHIWTDNDQ